MKGKLNSYTHTISACFIGYVVQAIIVNFAPLLFLTFQTSYHIPLSRITMLVTVNFGVQLLVDLLASKLVDKIGYRPCAVAAHLFSGIGLLLLAFLPEILPVPAVGLFIASAVYATGGGLIEVLISPIVEACPFNNKKSVMSLLHSFYSWGQVGVVALSTLFFVLAGVENWAILACVWAAIPFLNAVFFLFVPIYPLVEDGESAKVTSLLKSGAFWLFVVLMICAGSAEQSVSQWASAFAEEGLGVSKTVGDLLGPCLFAAMMGIARVAAEAKKCGRLDILAELTARGNEVLESLVRFQLPDGRFRDIVDDENSFVDGTSAMMMSVYIYRGVLEGWIHDGAMVDRADRALATVQSKVDRFGIVREVCGCPHFVSQGTSAEAQAALLMAYAWGERAHAKA